MVKRPVKMPVPITHQEGEFTIKRAQELWISGFHDQAKELLQESLNKCDKNPALEIDIHLELGRIAQDSEKFENVSLMIFKESLS